MKRIILLQLLVLAIALYSCDNKMYFDEYKSVDGGWHKDSIIAFNLQNIDTSQTYNMFITIRSNSHYQYSNIFLIASMENSNGLTKVDTLEYQMATPDGELLGSGITDIKESKLFYKEDVKIKDNCTVNIKQATRENGKIDGVELLEGITEIGLRIEKAKK